ncbi:MAG: LysR family transcriptional activator of nhaA [Candidatus Paceibacteria bacterium]|jgi:LysR family transcriptional activator of nhaA
MESLNYHHLRLFQAVAREGNLTRASARLHLTPQTVSSQVRNLEAALGEELFKRSGRRMILTDAGSVALGYADEIFALGQELQETLRGQPTDRPLRLLVGSPESMPKLIVHRLLEPALHLKEAVQIVCQEHNPTQLLADLAVHRLDVVLADYPIPPTANVRAYNHPLGSCGICFMAAPKLARRLSADFPSSLDGAPVLLPTRDAVLRRDLDRWFESKWLRPTIIGEFDDSALLKSFGQAGEGFFAIPDVVETEVARQYQVELIGRTDEIIERYYAISVERKVRHPAVAAICETARTALFSS